MADAPASRRHRIRLARESFKFSCAHMTVFPDGRKERLHGHNYFIELAIDVRDIGFQSIIEFAVVRDAIEALCLEWKEVLLLAEHNPFFEVVRHDAAELEFRLCGQRYVVPTTDVLMLPIDNITVEGLASHIASLLVDRLGSDVLDPLMVAGIDVAVNESPGQGASCYLPLTK